LKPKPLYNVSFFNLTNRYLKHARSQVIGSRTSVTFLPSANDRDV
jgi:hypothetical protein